MSSSAVPATATVASLVATVENSVSSLTAQLSGGVTSAASALNSAIPLIATILAAFAPGLTIGGIAATKVLAMVSGLLSGAPDLVNAYNAVKAAVDGGAAPTPEQWAALDAAADAAHAKLQADIAAYSQSS